MLAELRVRDLGVIESAEVVFGPGLWALTGETGAGKTMVVGALELLGGSRASGEVVRTGTDEADVEARFIVVGDDELIVRRVVPADGRSRAYLDGSMAPVAGLGAAVAERLELHAQGAHSVLRTAAEQLAALDRFGAVDAGPLSEVRAEIARTRAELSALGGDERERAREQDLLRFQHGELVDAGLKSVDEDEVLEAEEEALSGVAEHRAAAESAYAALVDEGGVVDALRHAHQRASGRGVLGELAERMAGAVADLDDIAADLRQAAESMVGDPERLEIVRVRRRQLSDLRRKYGPTLGDVLEFAADVERRLADHEHRDERAAALERRLAELQLAEADAAEKLRAQRAEAAPRLARSIEAHLGDLALDGAQVTIAVGGSDGSLVEFMLAANVGEEPRPLAKSASGGELSRIMLATRLVLASEAPTLVFDEVDAGVGGAAGVAVGRKLAELARDRQVIVVTHLPQVAVFADHHLVVSKAVESGRTRSEVREVTGDERIAEISRMLSGQPDGSEARAHAEALLTEAAEHRSAVVAV